MTRNSSNVTLTRGLKLPLEKYDVIIDIPRSVLYVVSYVAIKLGVPLSTPDNFDKISNSRNVESIYVLDKAVSVREFKAFLKDKGDLVWAVNQVTIKRIRGLFKPTFLRVCLRHPMSMWRMLT
jgi:hypothetical protein